MQTDIAGDDDRTEVSTGGDGGRASARWTDPLDPDGETSYSPQFQLEVGHVVVTDEHTGRETVLWKATADGEEVISDSPFDAVMGAIEAATGGVV